MGETFYISNKRTASIEFYLGNVDTLEDFEKEFPLEMLNDDVRVGRYLQQLLWKYDKKASTVSEDAMLAASYVGNIVNGKKNNPSRDSLLAICLAIGTTVEEVQYLLKYAGHAPLYVRRRRDVVIWFGFMKQMDLLQVDENLRKRQLKPLIRQL